MECAAILDIRTRRLLLRKLTEGDIPLYFQRLFSSPSVARYMLWQPHKDISESAASVHRSLKRYEEGNYYRWGVALREDDSLIGILELLRFDEAANTCSFAYMLGQDFWGQGYGAEALQAAFGFAFTELQLSAIYADHFADNPASGTAMRKAGMQYLGSIPGKYEKQGIMHDAVEYGITKEMWETTQRTLKCETPIHQP